MPIISITALKGGCSKSTIAMHAAGALAQSGRRVLVVDNDSQASLSSAIFGPAAVEQLDPSRTAAAIYSGPVPHPERIIHESGFDRLDIVPGSMAAGDFNVPRPSKAPMQDQLCLREFLAEVRGDYDVILIDNPPSLQLHNWAAMLAADYLLIPAQPEDFSSMSLSPVLEVARMVQAGPNRRVRTLGLVLTMVQPRLAVHVAYEKVLRDEHGAGVFETRIPIASDIKEAIAKGCPITNYKPKGASAKVFRALADEMLGRIESLTRTEAA